MKQNVDKPFHNKDSTQYGTVALNDDARALRVLVLIEHLANASHPLTLSQLAVRLQVPKATMMRMLDNLERHGYILRTPAGRGYVPGAAAAKLASATLRNNAFIRTCRATLSKLVAITGETCNLAMQQYNAVIYVDRVETEEPLRLHLLPGTRAPLHCTASGKLFLSRLELMEQRKVLAAMPLERRTPKTIIDPAQLEMELAYIAKEGIGIDDEEFVGGMVAIAVPISDREGRILAALACHSPVARNSVEQLLQYKSQLEDAALKLQPLLLG